MATLGGKHVQARTGRELTCQCICEVIEEAVLRGVRKLADSVRKWGSPVRVCGFGRASNPDHSAMR
jgi:hypothetical protein